MWLMKLSGLRLRGPRDMSMLCSIRRTMLGQCLGHIRTMFWLFQQYLHFYMVDMAQIFTEESCKPNRGIPINVKLLRPYKGHFWTILEQCLGYFYNIFASRCLKWLIFSLVSHASQIEENHSMLDYWNHIRAMFGPY